jgi:hypothetical protein
MQFRPEKARMIRSENPAMVGRRTDLDSRPVQPQALRVGFFNGSLALFIAGDFGFFTLIQSRDGPAR